MLDQKDLEAIRIIMKEELKDSENLVLGEVVRRSNQSGKGWEICC